MNVAYTTALRTSSEASSTTWNSGARLRPGAEFSRSRRRMFSTSMMASSTTTPMAMAKPPRVMVLMDTPHQSSTITAASSESGMETNEMNAVRKSSRKRNSTTATSSAAEQQRMVHVAQRRLDEVGRAEQARVQIDSLGGQRRFHLLQRGLQRAGDDHRVGLVLGVGQQDDARAAVDLRVAELRRRRFAHLGDVLEPHAQPRVRRPAPLRRVAAASAPGRWCG